MVWGYAPFTSGPRHYIQWRGQEKLTEKPHRFYSSASELGHYLCEAVYIKCKEAARHRDSLRLLQQYQQEKKRAITVHRQGARWCKNIKSVCSATHKNMTTKGETKAPTRFGP
ncbi:hypothetical protein FKM82_027529 [Ascaphus truei]